MNLWIVSVIDGKIMACQFCNLFEMLAARLLLTRPNLRKLRLKRWTISKPESHPSNL